MEHPFKIQLLSSDYNNMFDLDERVFYIQFESHKLNCGPHLLDRLVTFERETRNMFRNTLRRAFEGHGEEDRACLVICHPDLQDEVIVSLREIHTITEDTILDYIDEERLDAEKPFKFKFTIICTCNE